MSLKGRLSKIEKSLGKGALWDDAQDLCLILAEDLDQLSPGAQRAGFAAALDIWVQTLISVHSTEEDRREAMEILEVEPGMDHEMIRQRALEIARDEGLTGPELQWLQEAMAESARKV
jgi:hypothetical protein